MSRAIILLTVIFLAGCGASANVSTEDMKRLQSCFDARMKPHIYIGENKINFIECYPQ